jgi:hypothetical protein
MCRFVLRSILLRLGLASLLMLSACATRRIITINPEPPDSVLKIDGMDNDPGPVTRKFVFRGSQAEHTATASRLGYQDQTVTLEPKGPDTVDITLQPMVRTLTFIVSPTAAIVSVNGKPLSDGPVSRITKELPFTVDEQNRWTQYVVTAARVGFAPARVVVSETNPTSDEVALQLQPMRKDLSITTDPPGAEVSLDGQVIGNSPLVDRNRAFGFDVDANQFITRHLKLTKPGYDPLETTISWDDGQANYHFDLPAKRKTVRFLTDPAGATVTIDGKAIAPGPDGVPTTDLTFTPTDDKGDLPTFTATISKKTQETEWIPITIPVAWEDGRGDYSATLKEVKTKPVDLMSLSFERNADGAWEIIPRMRTTLGMKDISEGSGKEPPALIYSAPPGITIDTLTVSPTGSLVLFTVLSGETKTDVRAQILAISTDATGGVQQITDGKSLDIMPAFTPDGDEVVYCSNRAGRRLNIWRKSVTGGGGIEQLTNDEEQDLWPTIDAGPHPRLFYQVFSDSLADAQLYMSPMEGGPRSDLTTIPVSQPHISPKADSIVFTSINSRTNNREIYRIPDRGGPPVNLTNDPDSDCYDPTWSHDGNLVAYVSDRGMDEDRRRNADIWILDLTHPDKPIQITSNGSIDDCPCFDPTGDAIYFRSNRGGSWGIWKISIK